MLATSNAPFCFLLCAQGHLLTIQSQDAEYKAIAMAYNEKAQKISDDNVRIAEEITKAAQEATKAERIPVHAIIRFDEQICHSKNREEAARFAAF